MKITWIIIEILLHSIILIVKYNNSTMEGHHMIIKASAAIRQNYNEISELCKTSKEPVYLTKNGEGDLVVMDIDTFTRREKMLKLREKLLSVEENRLHGSAECTIDELDTYLESVIEDVANGSKQAV